VLTATHSEPDKNKPALVTGGALGAGKLLGKLLLQKGKHLSSGIQRIITSKTPSEWVERGFKGIANLIDRMI
jgi:hypothetical protein